MRNLKSLIFNLKSNRGVALYLALLIMAVLLSIGLALSVILMGQIRMIRGIGDSVIAFYAADTGIEKALLMRQGLVSIPPSGISGILENSARYEVTVFSGGQDDCPAENNFCIISVGAYRGVKRAIEVEY